MGPINKQISPSDTCGEARTQQAWLFNYIIIWKSFKCTKQRELLEIHKNIIDLTDELSDLGVSDLKRASTYVPHI